MNLSHIEKIADAVLYEGYILYPYRPSSVKNQQRWNFGALCPESYCLAQRGTESWAMQTECIVQQSRGAILEVKVRFLHLLTREVGRAISDCESRLVGIAHCEHREIRISNTTSHFSPTSSLEVNGQLLQTWQEAVERDVTVPGINLDKSIGRPQLVRFAFPESEVIEPILKKSSGEILGAIVRTQQAIEGAVLVQVSKLESQNAVRLTVQILNKTGLDKADQRHRDEALMRSFVSTHTILSVQNGAFVSLLDPPEQFREAAGACSNFGTYPVLAGEDGTHDCMLSSPIILYDYPQIAPESAGSLYDGTEIDEILTLRIMTLTDEEKREMRDADDRGRQILERTENLPQEQLMKMHGAMRSVKKAVQG